MDLRGQMREVCFFTGAFLIAWSWALVYYAFAHVAVGQSPLEDQIGFGGHYWRTNSIPLLIGQYLVVCGVVAALRTWLQRSGRAWAAALAVAVEFFPSPIFSGALMGYLGQFAAHSRFEHCAMNVAATWLIAAVVYSVPTSGALGPFSDVMQKTVGFGLGVAWNVLVAAAVPAAWSFRAHTLFLLLVMCLAASLVVPEPGASSLRQRHAELLSFASKVVCAFSLAGWLTYVTPSGLLGDLCAEVYLLFQAAAFSYLVANLDVDRPMGLPGAQGRKPDALERLVGCLVKVPCVWCCCPCIPLVWLMSRPHDGVKGRWLRLISDVSSLAASVVGTNLMTGGIDALAEAWQICGPDWCHEGAFLAVEVALAALASLTLLAAIVPLSPFAPPLPPSLQEATVTLIP